MLRLCYRPMAGDLADRLIRASELHGDFVLSSGKRSSVYFDKFRFLADPELLADVADAVRELVPDGTTHLASPEGAATLLLSAVAIRMGRPMVVVRKKPKEYGTRSQVEGLMRDGARVTLIEDVSTTGHQVAAAAKAVEREGGSIEAILLVIDRGGADPLEAAGYRVASVVSLRPET